MRCLFAAVMAGLFLAGCISTQEMPLAPNVVRLDTQARGLLFTSQTTSHTMRRAAEATLRNGFTHFRFADASVGQGSEIGGAIATNYGGSTTGVTTYGYGRAHTTLYSGPSTTVVTPTRVPTASVGVTVIMFRADEPGAQGAFEAAQVPRQQQ